jgi:CHAT domain-containing protein
LQSREHRGRFCRYALLFIVLACLPAGAEAQVETGRGAALDHLGRGTAAFRTGDMAAAVQEWSEAIRLARLIPAPDLEVQALARRGEAYRTQGYLRNADADLRAALAEAEASGNQNLIAASSGAMGNLELAARHTDLAEPLLVRSRDLARRLGDRNTLAASENDLGNLYAQTGRAAAAADAYGEAIASAAAAGDDTMVATVEVNAARLALHRNDPAHARALLTRAVDRLQRAPPSYSGAMALVSAGSAVPDRKGNISAEDRRIAERAFETAVRAADSLHNATLSSLARGGLGKLYEHTGRVGEASRLTDEALFAAQRAPAPELSYRWDWQQARLARRQGHFDTALASYRRAVAGLQSVRQDIPVEYRDGRSSYLTTFGPLYLEFGDLLLRRSAADPAHAAPLIREARDTIEQLKESELQDYFRDSCVTSFEARRQSIDTVAPGAAVLYPISLPDRLELLVSFGQEQRQFTIPVPEPALRAEVQRFRELLEKRTTNEYLVPAQQLYDQIIRPLDPLLAEHHIDTLVIVPDSVLRVVPFAALHDGRNFLIERYATAIAPSMHLIDPKPLAAGPRVALVLGISQSVQGFGDLPNVSREVSEVHDIEGGKELINDAFTQASFDGELKTVPYNIVHIASHGQFGADPKHTFLVAYDGQLNMDELETGIKYSEHREKALELLVLSACETATGDDRAALGLAGIALKAGARSAVASLWYVSDQATGRLVVDFYRALQTAGQSKARALQAAQRKLASSQRYAHPAYWAPFLLIGNWL